jgi:hypothetical protein
MTAIGFFLMWASAIYLVWAFGLLKDRVKAMNDHELLGAMVFATGLLISVIGINFWIWQNLP